MAQPVADFTFAPQSGKSPLTVQFTDTSTGSPTSWLWDFGDEDVSGDSDTSTDQNPSHQFIGFLNEKTTFTVTLIVRNALGVASEPKSQTVTITDSEFPMWAIILITLLSIIFLFLIIFLPLYLRKK